MFDGHSRFNQIEIDQTEISKAHLPQFWSVSTTIYL